MCLSITRYLISRCGPYLGTVQRLQVDKMSPSEGRKDSIIVATSGLSLLEVFVSVNGYILGNCARINVFVDQNNAPITRMKFVSLPRILEQPADLEIIRSRFPFVISIDEKNHTSIWLENELIGGVIECSFEASLVWGISALLHTHEIENYLLQKLNQYKWIKVSESKLSVDLTFSGHRLNR